LITAEYFLSKAIRNSQQAKDYIFSKYLVFPLKALYNLAQWQRPERTTPWVK
jgi:hypothetical protein